MRFKYGGHHYNVKTCVKLMFSAKEWETLIKQEFKTPKERNSAGTFVWWEFVEKNNNDDFKYLETNYVDQYDSFKHSKEYTFNIKKHYESWVFDLKRKLISEMNHLMLDKNITQNNFKLLS